VALKQNIEIQFSNVTKKTGKCINAKYALRYLSVSEWKKRVESA